MLKKVKRSPQTDGEKKMKFRWILTRRWVENGTVLSREVAHDNFSSDNLGLAMEKAEVDSKIKAGSKSWFKSILGSNRWMLAVGATKRSMVSPLDLILIKVS